MTQPHRTPEPDGHRFDPTILREYDVRGIVDKTLFTRDAYHIGRAFATKVLQASGSREICVAYDGRLSSPSLEQALCRGLVDSGSEVTRLGMGPTPMLYYGVLAQQAAGGIMVTGSHNPPDHNGFKFMRGKEAFFGKDIQELGTIALSGAFVAGRGHIVPHDLKQSYAEELLKAYNGTRALRVAWDAGNGAAGEIMAMLCASLPGTHFPLHAAIDGTFPAHHPDPTVPTNLADLIAQVKKEKCDLGIAFDGDGDRIGVVDETGEILWGDQLLAVLAADVLKDNPGATVIADVKASQVLFDEIARLGGVPLMWKTGHSLVKAKMKETGAKLAGEMSGHIFFADRYYGFDDALYAAVRTVGALSRSGRKLSELRLALPATVNTPELRFSCDDTRKFTVIDEVRARLEKEGADMINVDGVRVQTVDGWWLLRASNTQAVLVARCEAKDEAGLTRLKKALCSQLAQSGISLAA